MDAAAVIPETIRPLSRAEYDVLVARGAFADERVELLDGFLVNMSPQGPLHSTVTRRLVRLLLAALGDRAEVQAHSPLAISDRSEPEPDVAVLPFGDYTREHPRWASLVVEVADSSLRKDTGVKASLYAAARIPEYWVVDLVERAVRVFRDPGEGAYRSVSVRGPGDAIALVAFDDVRVAVTDLLDA